MVETRAITIETADSHAIAGHWVMPQETTGYCVIIAPATGIKQSFYRFYAQFLAAAGHAVLCFDYRGIGKNRPPSLRGFEANMSDWAKLDMVAAGTHARRMFGNHKCILVGHSFGGQFAGHLGEKGLIDAALQVSSGVGATHLLQPASYRWQARFMWWLFAPLTSRLMGYVPMSWLGGGEDLPSGVFMEWRRWCNGRYFDGFFDKEKPQYFQTDIPILNVHCEGDGVVNAETLELLFQSYRDAKIEQIYVPKHQTGGKPVGHLNYFRKENENIWADHFDRIAQRLS